MGKKRKSNTSNLFNVLKGLFIDAETHGGIEYIFTLVRVAGITRGKDPIIELSSMLASSVSALQNKKELLSAGIEECLALLSNVLYCSAGKAYNYCPFRHLYKGSVPNIVKPSLSQMVREIAKVCSETNQLKIKKLVEEKLIGAISRIDSSIASDSGISVEDDLRCFLQTLIEIYNAERLKFKNRPRLYKLPKFDVLELLVDDNRGLYGFFTHFSNGSSARFMRNEDSTEIMNITLDVPLGYFVGNLDNITEEWWVGDKRLYEVGLPGRYNKLGEWKPWV